MIDVRSGFLPLNSLHKHIWKSWNKEFSFFAYYNFSNVCATLFLNDSFKFFLQTGADKEDIEQLSKYTFRHNGCTENCTGEVQGTFGGFMTLCGRDTPTEHERALSIDDAVCSLAFLSFDLVLVYSDIYFWQNVLIACPFVVNRDVPYVCLLMMTEMNFVNFPVVTFFTALVSINGYI